MRQVAKRAIEGGDGEGAQAATRMVQQRLQQATELGGNDDDQPVYRSAVFSDDDDEELDFIADYLERDD